MPAKDMLLSFLEYNYWASEHVLRQVEKLSHDQLHAPVTISHGNAFDLVRHILDTDWSWRGWARGEEGNKYLWDFEDMADLPAIRRLWRQEHERTLDYVRSLSDSDLERPVDYGTAQGREPNYGSPWQILLHIVNHSTHHRSELSRYLDDCGSPIQEEDLDYLTFVERTARGAGH